MNAKNNVTGRVISYIRNNIRSGTWQLNEKLPSESELCKTLNVSRITVRNALKQFISLGILESIHGKGTYLRNADIAALGAGQPASLPSSDTKDMLDLLAFRALIEPDVCALVAPTASPELIAILTHFLDAMKESQEDDASFVTNDILFHMTICQETKNPILIGVMTEIFEKRREVCQKLHVANGYYGGVYYHSLLISAFKNQDAKLARSLMKEHLERGILDVTADNN